MAILKRLSTRIVQKHATPSEWFVSKLKPLQGELIVYDPGYDPSDEKTYTVERMKIGNGVDLPKDLPFVNDINLSVTEHVSEISVVTDTGIPVYTPSNYVAPSLNTELDGEKLIIKFDKGSYTPAEFVAGDSTKTKIEYLTGISVSNSNK